MNAPDNNTKSLWASALNFIVKSRSSNLEKRAQSWTRNREDSNESVLYLNKSNGPVYTQNNDSIKQKMNGFNKEFYLTTNDYMITENNQSNDAEEYKNNSFTTSNRILSYKSF